MLSATTSPTTTDSLITMVASSILQVLLLLVSSLMPSTNAFSCSNRITQHQQTPSTLSLHAEPPVSRKNEHLQESTTVSSSPSQSSRRDFFVSSVAVMTTMATASESSPAMAASSESFKPAIRPLTYRVDSTIPPTLLSVTPGQSLDILQNLAKGSGTDKQAIVIDTINLNNMLNKAVFGTSSAVQNVLGLNQEENSKNTNTNNWKASFVCLGLEAEPASIQLAQDMVATFAKSKNSQARMGLGLYFCPYSTQSALQQYTAGNLSWTALAEQLEAAGVSETTRNLYKPLLESIGGATSTKTSIDLIAMAPEVQDIAAVRANGIPGVDAARRAQYVRDATGFIGQTTDPQFKLYTDKSLVKDYREGSGMTLQNFFAERILVHEAGASALADYAVQNNANAPSFVVALAPTADVRYLSGINGRLPRVCQALQPASGVTDNAVTTILLNPTAPQTLSTTQYLRLEIGTGPDTLPYQTKIADYLWFSTMPKVNMIPRLMN